MTFRVCVALAGLLVAGIVTPVAMAGSSVQSRPGLVPTEHAPLPATADDAWLVPASVAGDRTVLEAFATGVRQFNEGNYGQALLKVSEPRLASTPLAAYGTYYTALCYLRLSRPAEARTLLEALKASSVSGALGDAALFAEAEAAETAGDLAAAARLFDALLARQPANPEVVLDRLARATAGAGDSVRADAARLRLWSEYPASAPAIALAPLIEDLRRAADSARLAELNSFEVARGERLFTARRYADAQASFERVLPSASDDQRELADLRIAECEYFQRRHRSAIERLQPHLETAARRAEARFFHLSALRGLGQHEAYIAAVRTLVADFPSSSWAEDALNALASHFIVQNDDAAAAGVFAEIFERYPASRHMPRAAWKLGWWRYQGGDHAGAIAVFEQAAERAPRSDYRPSWLYWAARAHGLLGRAGESRARYEVVVADYLHSYYGRLAVERLDAMGIKVPAHGPADAADAGGATRTAAPPPRNHDVIRALLSVNLYDLAQDELQHAQRTSGSSPSIEATLAWIYNRQGDLRRGITLMRRAYPQFMAAGGERLPADLRRIIFPLSYADLIRKHAVRHGLDPNLITALVAQESTFDASARSAANAYGLMQIVPATGRRLARDEKLRRFRTSMLTDPETNVRLGTRYFASLVRQFGDAHLALACYNAGESRVRRWRAERPGLERDEFIDDIPFPETQNYVKRILGTAEDYRLLYP
jgi:soluble lytic murein transglycosylase